MFEVMKCGEEGYKTSLLDSIVDSNNADVYVADIYKGAN